MKGVYYGARYIVCSAGNESHSSAQRDVMAAAAASNGRRRLARVAVYQSELTVTSLQGICE